MKLRFSAAAIVAFSIVMAHFAFADQLDEEAAAKIHARVAEGAPAAVLVKVDPSIKTVTVYKAPTVDDSILHQTASRALTEAAIHAIEIPANKLAEFKQSTHELDSCGSTGACWLGGWLCGLFDGGCNWGWNNWGGDCGCYNWAQPYYYPGYFSYNSYYNYSYYWNYGYNNCYYGWYY